MLNRTILWTAGCVAAAGLTSLMGCDKSGGSAPREIDPQAVVGTWLEVRESASAGEGNIRRATGEWESDNIRQITLNADNTFKLIVCKPSGSPLDATKSIEGTWKAEGEFVSFTVTANTLTGIYKDWAPRRFFGPFNEGGTSRCAIEHENGEEGTYELQK